MDLKKLQKEIYQNKVDKGFNTTDVNKEFCLLYGEVGEAYDAYRKGKDDLGEELAQCQEWGYKNPLTRLVALFS